jgi:hypothetical protein
LEAVKGGALVEAGGGAKGNGAKGKGAKGKGKNGKANGAEDSDSDSASGTGEYAIANAGFAHDYQLLDVGDFMGRGESSPTPFFYQNLGEAEYVVAVFQVCECAASYQPIATASCSQMPCQSLHPF